MLPWPGSLSNRISPSWASTMRRAMAKPMPVPWIWAAWEPVPRTNLLKISFCSEAGMPMPRSRTRMARRPRSRAISTQTVRHSGEYLTALSSRFRNARPRASRSARMSGDSPARQLDAITLGGGLLLKFGHHVADQRDGIERLEAIAERARFDAAEIQQRLDQPLQPLALAGQDVVGFLPLLLRGDPPFGQHLRKLAQRGERGPEFVRHRRDELGLKPGHGPLAVDGAHDEIGAGQKHQGQNREARKQQAAAPGKACRIGAGIGLVACRVPGIRWPHSARLAGRSR